MFHALHKVDMCAFYPKQKINFACHKSEQQGPIHNHLEVHQYSEYCDLHLYKSPLNHGFPALHFIFFTFIIIIVFFFSFCFLSFKAVLLSFHSCDKVSRYLCRCYNWDDCSTTLLQCLVAGVAVLQNGQLGTYCLQGE